MAFEHKQIRELRAPVVKHDEVSFSNQLVQELYNRGFFSVRLEEVPGKPYIKTHATFVCDRIGLVEINEFSGLNASENSIGNKLLRYRDFYFECKEKWEASHGTDPGKESEEQSSEGVEVAGGVLFFPSDGGIRWKRST